MASTVIAGKPSNTVGEKDSALILRGSSVKVQWGNKFIDLIKNGKINIEQDKLLKLVDSVDNIKQDGIYLVDDQVWVTINGTKIQLSGNASTVYVSFVDTQNMTYDNKNKALHNIGFYYDSIEDVKKANISSGLIYVLGDNKLYSVIDGVLSEYYVSQSKNEYQLEKTLTKELYIKNYSLYIGDEEYIQCNNSEIRALKRIITEEGIQSSEANSDYGYRIYMESGRSILEIDEIRERNPSDIKIPHTLYTKYNNIVTNAVIENDKITCTLQEENKYQVDEWIYIYTYCLMKDTYIDGQLTITLSIPIDKDIKIVVNDNIITIPKGTQSYTTSNFSTYPNIKYPKIQKVLREYKILETNDQTIVVDVPDQEHDMFLKNCTYIYNSRNPYLEIQNNKLILLDRSKTITNEITGLVEPDETIHSSIGINKESDIENLKIVESIEGEQEYKRPDVGIYSDCIYGLNPILYNTIFKVAGKKDFNTEHYKYPKYDNSVVLPEKELIYDKKFNQVVPDLQWIKQITDYLIPIGTIIMWYGSVDKIPPGWAICDGNNNTPNLIDRFIKGGTICEEVIPQGVNITEDGYSRIMLEEKNLPEHHHEHNPHTHTITKLSGSITDSGPLSTSFNQNNYLYNFEHESSELTYTSPDEADAGDKFEAITKVSVGTQGGSTSGADHTHSITLEGGEIIEAISTEKEKVWTNEEILIEPRHFKLIFIMKVKNFVDLN